MPFAASARIVFVNARASSMVVPGISPTLIIGREPSI